MILIMVTYLQIIVKIIITKKVRKILMKIVLYSKMMIKIELISTNMKNLQDNIEEEADVVCIDPYQALMVEINLTGLIGIN